MLPPIHFQVVRNGVPLPPPPASNIAYITTGNTVPLFEEMDCAAEYGKTPTEWFREPRWSRAVMVAVLRQKNRLEYWIAEDARDA